MHARIPSSLPAFFSGCPFDVSRLESKLSARLNHHSTDVTCGGLAAPITLGKATTVVGHGLPRWRRGP